MENNEHQVDEMKEVDELTAIKNAYDALKNLDDAGKQRAFSWLQNKLNISKQSQGNIPLSDNSEHKSEINNGTIESFASVPDIFAAANAKKEVDKVLLVASYLQLKNNMPDLTGRDVNKELQHLGHAVKNITTTIQGLIDKKPQLMIQTWKSGKSKQAQKKYKVTSAGIDAAKKLLVNKNISDGE